MTSDLTIMAPDRFRVHEIHRNKFRRVTHKVVSGFLENLIPSSLRGSKKLEVGAGDGQTALDLPDWMLKDSVLLEPSQEAIELGKTRNPAYRYQQGTIRELEELFGASQLGIIYGKDVFDFIHNVEVAVQDIYDNLQQGGIFFHYCDILPDYNTMRTQLKTDSNYVILKMDMFGIPEQAWVVESEHLNPSEEYLSETDIANPNSHLNHLVAEGKAQITSIDPNTHYISLLEPALRSAGFKGVQTSTLDGHLFGERTEGHNPDANYFWNNSGRPIRGDFPADEPMEEGRCIKEGEVLEGCSLLITVAHKD